MWYYKQKTEKYALTLLQKGTPIDFCRMSREDNLHLLLQQLLYNFILSHFCILVQNFLNSSTNTVLCHG